MLLTVSGKVAECNFQPFNLRHCQPLHPIAVWTLDAQHDSCDGGLLCNGYRRYLLLARQHGHAAAKAINSMQPVLADMQRLVVMQTAAGLSSTSNMGSHQTSAPVTQQQQRTSLLLSSAPVVELLRWHSCLESLDKAELPLSCWHDVFAHLLLTGALRAFSYAYQQVRWMLCCVHVVSWLRAGLSCRWT